MLEHLPLCQAIIIWKSSLNILILLNIQICYTFWKLGHSMTQALLMLGPRIFSEMPLPLAHEDSLASALTACYSQGTAHRVMNATRSRSPHKRLVLPGACWSYIFFWLFYNSG